MPKQVRHDQNHFDEGGRRGGFAAPPSPLMQASWCYAEAVSASQNLEWVLN